MPQRSPKAIDQVVAEVGLYPMDAFAFVQECVGLAADRVHGPLSPDGVVAARWMSRHEVSPDELRRLFEDNRLPADVMRAVQALGGPAKLNRHITGQQLCWTVRDVAVNRWGLLARTVLARWNIRSTEDVGAIIFALVEHDWLQKQPEDTIDDFKAVFRFDEAFDHAYQIQLT